MDTNNIRILTENFIKQLNDFYNGDSWVTYNLTQKVFSLPDDLAFKKVAGHTHSIAQQVAHMNAWRNFGVQKLKGNNDFNIANNTPADWPEPVDWSALKNEFETCHRELITAIKNFPVDKWGSQVPLRDYSFMYLINGIVEHDYYHHGQIGALLAAIDSRKNTRTVKVKTI
jgi:uncharacterized damage-inducible protein DinB